MCHWMGVDGNTTASIRSKPIDVWSTFDRTYIMDWCNRIDRCNYWEFLMRIYRHIYRSKEYNIFNWLSAIGEFFFQSL